MLFAQGVAAVNQSSNKLVSKLAQNEVVKERVPVVIVQILTETISTQNNNGTWGPLDDVEMTAYTLLALLEILTLPYVQAVRIDIQCAVMKGRDALASRQDAVSALYVDADSDSLSERLSLLTDPADFPVGEPRSDKPSAFDEHNRKIHAFVIYFSSLDYLRSQPYARVKSSILEASLYRPFLLKLRTDIFPLSTAKEQDKYLDYIPIMWTLSSTCHRVFVPPEYLIDMMVLSMWIFLTDEYMESKVAKFSKDDLSRLRKHVKNLYYEETFQKSQERGSSLEKSHSIVSKSEQLAEAISVFTAFAKTVMNYPHVVNASKTDKLDLRFEMKNYLLYHLHQLDDNACLARQPQNQQQQAGNQTTRFLTPRTSFPTWLHTVGAGHISGPFAWAFFACSMGGSLRGGNDCFSTPKQKLIAHKMNAHHGAFSRLYNDYGSIRRDAHECNLNSLNFPEFAVNANDNDSGSGRAMAAVKQMLLDAAQYERKCALDTAEVLYHDLESAYGVEGKTLADRIRVYIGAGEQFSDMYLTRDVTNSVK
ncbi:MAG: hypothetical protein L6R39_001019 [Caloplaca ligustica]|nr:MAG: hypothetical protein L6R39_001019 [Caloplaca ligustica]